MTIGIIGMGYVGRAVAHTLPIDTTLYLDPKAGYSSCTMDDIKKTDAVVICVPTPSNPNGSCNTSILKKVIDDLNVGSLYNGVMISKSTAPPQFYKELHRRYVNLVHVPEFLRANSANEDYQNSEFAIFGGNPGWTHSAEDILTQGKYKPKHISHMPIEAAALYKYMANSFLASKLVWMNEFKELADSLGVDWLDLTESARLDSRIGSGHTMVPGPDGKFGYAGACFPKDISAIMHMAKDKGVDLSILDTVVSKNDILRQKV